MLNIVQQVELRPIAVIAGKEFWDRIRNRWVLAIALIFAIFALVIAYFGAAQQGTVGFRGIDVTIASLVSLVIYLMPLIALILGYDAIVGERDRGSLELLLSMPITPLELLLGKYLGLAGALAGSTLFGFGLAGVVLIGKLGAKTLLPYIGFMASSLLLGFAFLSIAILVSAIAKDRVRASGVAIGLWFFYVLIYDLILLGILVLSANRFNLNFFPFLLFLNPADLFRIVNVFGMEEVRKLYGLATVIPAGLTNPWLLISMMWLWIIAPLGIAGWRFNNGARSQ